MEGASWVVKLEIGNAKPETVRGAVDAKRPPRHVFTTVILPAESGDHTGLRG